MKQKNERIKELKKESKHERKKYNNQSNNQSNFNWQTADRSVSQLISHAYILEASVERLQLLLGERGLGL